MRNVLLFVLMGMFSFVGGRSEAQVANNCGMKLGGPVTFCDTFDVVNPGIPSRTGGLDPNVWGVSRGTGNMNFSPDNQSLHNWYGIICGRNRPVDMELFWIWWRYEC